MELHEIDMEIATLERLNRRSQELLFLGSKTREQRMELNAWIGRNDCRVRQLKNQRLQQQHGSLNAC